MNDELTSGVGPDEEGVPGDEDVSDDDEPVEDEFDPFADRRLDPPPEEGEEGDDRVHGGTDG